MGCSLDHRLEYTLSGLPTSAEALRRRWALAREAVLALEPDVRTWAPDDVEKSALPLFQASLELFLFGARYRKAFENAHRFDFLWRIDVDPDAPDCRLQVEGLLPPEDPEADWFLLHLVIAPSQALESVRARPKRVPRPEAALDLLDGLLHAMLRLMLQAAAAAVCVKTSEILVLTASLLERVEAVGFGTAD